MDQLVHPGFFGKLPCNGDFVTRRLPRSPFLDVWDEWLQQSIANSQEKLMGDWLSLYLTSPIWRFALSPGICGDNVWTGLIMPSVDKVGRYYPLTIATSLSNATNPVLLLNEASEWFQNAEDVALSALADDLDLEKFDCDVVALGMPPVPNNLDNQRYEIQHSVPLQLNLSTANDVADTYPFFVKLLIDSNYTNYSLWWTNGSDHVKPRLIVCPNLPLQESFCAFLDGQWEHWGWPKQVNNIVSTETDSQE